MTLNSGHVTIAPHKVERVNEEMLIYSEKLNNVLSLNGLAAFIFDELCDAQRQHAEITTACIADKIMSLCRLEHDMFDEVCRDVDDAIDAFCRAGLLACGVNET